MARDMTLGELSSQLDVSTRELLDEVDRGELDVRRNEDGRTVVPAEQVESRLRRTRRASPG